MRNAGWCNTLVSSDLVQHLPSWETQGQWCFPWVCQRGPVGKTAAVGMCYGTQLQMKRKFLCNFAMCCHFACVRNASFCPTSFPSLLLTSPGLASCPDCNCLGIWTEEKFEDSFLGQIISKKLLWIHWHLPYRYAFRHLNFWNVVIKYWPGNDLWTLTFHDCVITIIL